MKLSPRRTTRYATHAFLGRRRLNDKRFIHRNAGLYRRQLRRFMA